MSNLPLPPTAAPHHHHHHHHVAAAAAAAAVASPKSSGRHISFTLCTALYSWLESMAVLHNYGSVHKSVRDLLCWACTGQEEDYEWLFLTPHDTPSSSSSSAPFCHRAADGGVALRQACAILRSRSNIVVDARVPDGLFTWITTVAKQYHLPRGASSVLEILCKCAIELDADDDIFESNECGHDLAENTAQLYHDLGLIRAVHPEHNQLDDADNETDVELHASPADSADHHALADHDTKPPAPPRQDL